MIPLPNRTFADIKQLPEAIFTTPDGQVSSTVFWGDPVNGAESSGAAFQANKYHFCTVEIQIIINCFMYQNFIYDTRQCFVPLRLCPKGLAKLSAK